jgi:hypothetical protein
LHVPRSAEQDGQQQDSKPAPNCTVGMGLRHLWFLDSGRGEGCGCASTYGNCTLCLAAAKTETRVVGQINTALYTGHVPFWEL